MPDVLTHSDLFQSARREVILPLSGGKPSKFDPAVVDLEGSDINILANIIAACGEDIGMYVIQSVMDMHLSTVRPGEPLERWVYDRYGIVKKRATSAVVTLTLTRSNTYPVTVESGSVFSTASGSSYTTQVDTAFGNGNKGPIKVLAVSQVAGSNGRAGIGEITIVSTPQEDPTILVTNEEASAGGDDGETDDQLISRARQFFPSARRGTKAAIEFGARTVDRVSMALANELIIPDTGLPGYRVSMTVSDLDGHANSAVVQDVHDALVEYRSLGVPVNVIAGSPQYVNIRVDGLVFEAGANTQSVLANARSAIESTVNSLSPGETLRRNAIASVLGRVYQLIVPSGAIVEPAGDLVPDPGKVIRTTPGRITL